MTTVESVNMRCSSSEYALSIPIPMRWKVNSAVVRFKYQNSASLLKRTSQLEMLLNEVPLAQVRLDPIATSGRVKLDLPPLLLQSDYNALTFRVAQHYSTQCENPCAPELWTRLELGEAEIEIDYDYRPVPLRISAVSDFLFDAKLFPHASMNIITQGLDDANLTISAIVASGVALRYDFRKVVFTSSNLIIQGQDNILVGDHNYIKQFLGKYDIPYDKKGPYLRMLHLPQRKMIESVDIYGKKIKEEVTVFDKRFALILISGDNMKQVLMAAETLDILSIPFPESPDMEVKAFSMPEIAQYSGKQMLTTDREYRLNKLKFFSRTFRGLNATPSKLVFRVPSDFRVKPNQYVQLKLDFAYGAGIRSDSSLNIILNGNHVAAIHVDNEDGGMFTDYQLNLPTHLFKGGENVLAFEAVLTPSVTEHCGFIQSDNLFLTLFDSSTFLFPSMPHEVEMPNLELLFVNGFPYTRWPDGYESLLYLPNANRNTVSVALNLAAIITQKNGYPLFGIEVKNKVPDKYDGEIIVIGKVKDVDSKFLDMAPLVLGETNKVPYPAFESWEQRKSLAYSTQVSDMGKDQGYITQFESPYKIGRTATLFTAQSDEGINRLGKSLWETPIQSAAKGDLMLIDYIFNPYLFDKFGDGRDFHITAMAAGKTFITGKGGEVNTLKFYLSAYPWVFWVAIPIAILVLTLISFILLKRHRKKRLGGSKDK